MGWHFRSLNELDPTEGTVTLVRLDGMSRNCVYFSFFCAPHVVWIFELMFLLFSLAPFEFERRWQSRWNYISSSTYERYQRSSQLAKMEEIPGSPCNLSLFFRIRMANHWCLQRNRSYPREVQIKSQ